MTVDLRLGDCLEVMKTLPDGSVDAVITDPPYGCGKYATDIEFTPDLITGWKARYKSVAVFGFPELLVKWCVQSGNIPNEWVTWWATNKFNGNCKALPRESETIAIFGATPGARLLYRPRVQNKHTVMRAVQRGLDPDKARLGDVWRDASPGMAYDCALRQHPNEKPITLMEKLITLCTKKGDTILDPFMGSGTTGVACVKLNRNFIGIEINPQYYAIAKKRIAEAQAQLALPV